MEGEYRSPFTAYYYNLLNAQQNRLPDRLMDGYQPASRSEERRVGKAHNKVIAVTETGYEGIPDAKWWPGTLLPCLLYTSRCV